jgi:hypothetical protein
MVRPVFTDQTKRKRNLIGLRVTDAEYQHITSEAARMNITVTEYLRRHLGLEAA